MQLTLTQKIYGIAWTAAYMAAMFLVWAVR